MKNLAIIPARSGSKSLPDKNILPLAGKPLLAWSIDAALQSGMFDTVHVSTDSEKYAEIAREYGADVPFLRSAEAASDTASSWLAVTEAIEGYGRMGNHFDTVALLQPTSPLRTPADIRGAYQLMNERCAKTVISVCEADHSPLWCNVLPENGCMDQFIDARFSGPRQSLPQYYRINGAIYLYMVEELLSRRRVVYDADCYAYIMPKERSIDIDSQFDFLIAEQVSQQETGYMG